MTWLYILGGVAVVLAVSVCCVAIGRLGNWLKRRHGVTELTPRQRRLQAQRYTETTGKRFMKSKKRRTRKATYRRSL